MRFSTKVEDYNKIRNSNPSAIIDQSGIINTKIEDEDDQLELSLDGDVDVNNDL